MSRGHGERGMQRSQDVKSDKSLERVQVVMIQICSPRTIVLILTMHVRVLGSVSLSSSDD